MATWLRNWSKNKSPLVNLVCFPGLAGGAHMYRHWAQLLDDDVAVLGMELPGHGARAGELPPTDLDGLVMGPLLEAVSAVSDRPLAIFGHSLGALVGIEVCQRLVELLGKQPVLFVAAGCAAPGAEHVPPGAVDMTDAEIVAFLRTNGGTSHAILSDPAYVSLLIPLVRAEFRMINGHHFRAEPMLACPVRVYLGMDDPSVSIASARGWEAVTTGQTAIRTLPGGHFFIQHSERETLQQLAADLGMALHSGPQQPAKV
jgi:medium-chain acyl-[acyl-carrier-protein] hydrolase